MRGSELSKKVNQSEGGIGLWHAWMQLTATGLLSGRGIDLGRRRHGGSSPLRVLSE